MTRSILQPSAVERDAEGPASSQRLLSSRRSRVVAAAIVAVLLVQLCAGLLPTWNGSRDYVALVGPTGWQIDGDFFPLRTIPPDVEVPKQVMADPMLTIWRTWDPKLGNTKGSIASPPFATPEYVAVFYMGFPGESPGNRIFLRCDDGGRDREVATLRTNSQWAGVFVRLGADFCRGQSRLMASSDGGRYVAVMTPFRIDRGLYEAQTAVAPRAAIALLTIVFLVAHLFVGDRIARRWSGGGERLVGGFVFVGCVAMAEIALFVAWPAAAPTIAALAGVAIVGVFVVALMRDAAARRWLVALAGPLASWGLVCLAYVALTAAVDSGGGSWAVNGLFAPLRWSSDNQLPMQVTEAFYHGIPPDRIMLSSWHGFDRTPLMSGLLLPLRALFAPIADAYGTIYLPTAYMAASIAIISLWVPVVWEACRLGGRPRAGALAVVFAALGPFFLFNTVYAWPKLLGAAFVLLAFCVLYRMRDERVSRPADVLFVAVLAACAYLAHGSNAFALVVVAIAFLPTLLRQRPVALAWGVFAGAALVVGWTVFVGITQPHSNALLRYALANDFGFADRTVPIWQSVAKAYGDLGWSGWLRLKGTEFVRLFAFLPYSNEMATYVPGSGAFGEARVADFSVLVRGIGIAALGTVVALVVPARWMGGGARAARSMARVGAAAIAMSVLILLPEATIHQLPYGAVLLLFVGGALTLDVMPRPMRAAALAFAVLYALAVWIVNPLDVGLRANVPAQILLVECCAALALLGRASSRPPAARATPGS